MIDNKTGLESISVLVKRVHYFGGWVQGAKYLWCQGFAYGHIYRTGGSSRCIKFGTKRHFSQVSRPFVPQVKQVKTWYLKVLTRLWLKINTLWNHTTNLTLDSISFWCMYGQSVILHTLPLNYVIKIVIISYNLK